jgi:DNA-binding transcriptional ArsR family regulator
MSAAATRSAERGPRAHDLDRTLSALADPTRRRVVELLRERPRRAGELAAAFRVSAPAMSRHLRVLRRRGLVEEERVDEDARVRVYRLRRERFRQLQEWLGEVEAFWTDQLEAFKAHAERTHRDPVGRGGAAPRGGRGGRRS